MRRKLLCIVLAMLLLLSACADDSATVRKGKTRKAPEAKSGRSEEITPTPNRDTPSPTPTSEPEPTVIRMWCNVGETYAAYPAYCLAIEEMKKKYPDIRFEWEGFSDVEEYKVKVKAALANPEGNALPDIFHTNDRRFLAELIRDGRVLCLDEYYEDYAGFLPKSRCEGVAYEGKLYGVPTNYNVVLMFSNMDILAKAGYAEVPSTLAELAACCDRLLALGYTPFSIAAGPYTEWCVSEYLEPVLLQFMGADALKDLFEGRSTWNNPDVAKAVDLLAEMMQKKYFAPECLNMSSDEAKSYFMEGKSAFYLSGSWNCADFSHIPNGGDIIQVGTFPIINPEKGSSNAFIGGPTGGLAVYRNSPNAEIAAEYAFELTRLINAYGYLYGCGFSAFNDYYDDDEVNYLTRKAARLLTDSELVLFGDTVLDDSDLYRYYSSIGKILTGEIDGAGFIEYMKSNTW